MRKEVSSLIIAGTLCGIAVYALLNVENKRTALFMNDDNSSEFLQFVGKFRRSYGTKEEFEFRKNLFLKKHNEIQAFNNAGHLSTMEVNHFTDWSEAELSKFLSYVPDTTTEKEYVQFPEVNDVANGVDWRAAGAVTGVKNQGSCGSCWAFSSTGCMEGAHKIAKGELLSLSEQQLVDCSGTYGNLACNGGRYDWAFTYAYYNPLELEQDYTYTGVRGACQYNAGKARVQALRYQAVYQNNAQQMLNALNSQPVSVSVQANQNAFMHYAGGILTNANCPGTRLDHAILAVGYGVENGVNYYIVKNSWGTGWGEAGYIRMEVANGYGTCGIQMDGCVVATN